MALIGKNLGFGSGIDIFTAIELSLINSMEILDSNARGLGLEMGARWDTIVLGCSRRALDECNLRPGRTSYGSGYHGACAGE